VSGGGKGLAGSVSAIGAGGNGGGITVFNSRAKLTCTAWSSIAGLNGYSGNGVAVLTGESGVVHTMGLYNRSSYTSTLASGAGTTLTLKPYYGIGAGYGSPPIWGYMVLYW
jgi:hypothetical protein